MNIVIDTNRFISALIKEGTTREIIVKSNDTLLFPEIEFQEISKYKDEILEKSGLSEVEFNILLSNLLTKVRIIKTDQIISFKDKADRIMEKIDLDDSIFVATALAFNCPIWSDDNHFKQQNEVGVMTNSDMLRRLDD